MKCPICKRQLRIGKTYMSFKNDDTPDLPTEAYQNHEMLCLNPKCPNFSGDKGTGAISLEEPISVVSTTAIKVN